MFQFSRRIVDWVTHLDRSIYSLYGLGYCKSCDAIRYGEIKRDIAFQAHARSIRGIASPEYTASAIVSCSDITCSTLYQSTTQSDLLQLCITPFYTWTLPTSAMMCLHISPNVAIALQNWAIVIICRLSSVCCCLWLECVHCCDKTTEDTITRFLVKSSTMTQLLVRWVRRRNSKGVLLTGGVQVGWLVLDFVALYFANRARYSSGLN